VPGGQGQGNSKEVARHQLLKVFISDPRKQFAMGFCQLPDRCCLASHLSIIYRARITFGCPWTENIFKFTCQSAPHGPMVNTHPWPVERRAAAGFQASFRTTALPCNRTYSVRLTERDPLTGSDQPQRGVGIWRGRIMRPNCNPERILSTWSYHEVRLKVPSRRSLTTPAGLAASPGACNTAV